MLGTSPGGGASQESVDALEVKLDELPGKFGDIGVKLDSLEVKLDELPGKLDDIVGKLDDVLSKLDDVGSKLDSLEVKLDEIPSKLDDIAVKLDSIEVKLDEIPSKLNEQVDDEAPNVFQTKASSLYLFFKDRRAWPLIRKFGVDRIMHRIYSMFE